MLGLKKKSRINIHNNTGPLPIVSTAAIATPEIADGRLVPIIIVDSKERPDFVELVKAHKYLPPGDVTVWWGTIEGQKPDTVTLFMQFTNPAELIVYLEFDIAKEGILVDQILVAKCVLIHIGKPGDRYSQPPKKPGITIEVPDTKFGNQWELMFHNSVAKEFRRSGLSRKAAQKAAIDAISRWRKLGQFRMAE